MARVVCGTMFLLLFLPAFWSDGVYDTHVVFGQVNRERLYLALASLLLDPAHYFPERRPFVRRSGLPGSFCRQLLTSGPCSVYTYLGAYIRSVLRVSETEREREPDSFHKPSGTIVQGRIGLAVGPTCHHPHIVPNSPAEPFPYPGLPIHKPGDVR